MTNDTEPETTSLDESAALPSTSVPAAAEPEPAADPARPPRYGANVRLIKARLADEKRMSRVRRWWQSKH